ncbi:RecQ family ATP-dependent DNA helicase [Selenihalanaerobacter shriftii]|uniref:ATP-dependent DNA helicase RecQ n=1 Tax=Selenihalanaerobacter shriftii TaxID=142842 RepID=A0A1T4PT17_9FIRM|nr:RecQ family ATP-dependent DNA helicase [Selenihalanaerobacter shriftii]SJZ94720.1 ATP-dependent DNA helicase RecQ [Selenihalanaerobacter shriftii]
MDLPKIVKIKLREYFGYSNFRNGQKEILKHVFANENILGILPTGSGKSLCYQIPAVCDDFGLVIVISPLISLMKDQIDSLRSKGIKAAYINSTLNRFQRQQILNEISYGEYDIIYVAPERFRSKRFIKAVNKLKVGLLAIDEAHCISKWGHNFRPDYSKLAQAKEVLGNPQVLAVTATATSDVRRDIINKLEIEDCKVIIKGFTRNNLNFEVREVRDKQEKAKELLTILRKEELPAIIYTGTRNNVGELMELLNNKFSVIGYHGGMSLNYRKKAQDLFMNGERDIVVATNAFGMGVDKEDVRLVVHYNFPANIEAYYQEAGRAGRDRFSSKCILLYCHRDTRLIKFFIEADFPEKNLIKRVYKWLIELENNEIRGDIYDLAARIPFSISNSSLESILSLLIKNNYLKKVRSSEKSDVYKLINPVLPEELQFDFKRLKKLKKNKYNKLKKIQEYATTDKCHHQFILNYFGNTEELEECPGCDNCFNIDLDQVTIREEKIIYGILKMINKLDGKFGVTTVAKILAKSKAKKILKRGLHRLENYGMLKNYTQKKVIEVINKLIKKDILQKTDQLYPTIELAHSGYNLLQNPYSLNWSLNLPQKKFNDVEKKLDKKTFKANNARNELSANKAEYLDRLNIKQLRQLALDIGNKGIKKDLLPQLYNHTDYEVRRRACSAAKKLADKELVKYIAPCLQAKEAQVRQYALKAVLASGCKEMLEVVYDVLDKESKDYNIRLCKEIIDEFKCKDN